jgi:hypothetical protein
MDTGAHLKAIQREFHTTTIDIGKHLEESRTFTIEIQLDDQYFSAQDDLGFSEVRTSEYAEIKTRDMFP